MTNNSKCIESQAKKMKIHIVTSEATLINFKSIISAKIKQRQAKRKIVMAQLCIKNNILNNNKIYLFNQF